MASTHGIRTRPAHGRIAQSMTRVASALRQNITGRLVRQPLRTGVVGDANRGARPNATCRHIHDLAVRRSRSTSLDDRNPGWPSRFPDPITRRRIARLTCSGLRCPTSISTTPDLETLCLDFGSLESRLRVQISGHHVLVARTPPRQSRCLDFGSRSLDPEASARNLIDTIAGPDD